MSEKNRFLGSMSNSALQSLLPKSVLSKSRMSSTRPKSKFGSENTAPTDPNIQISDPPLFSSNSLPKKALSKLGTPPKELVRSEAKAEVSEAPDSPPVKVTVRIKTGNALANGDRMIRGVSKDSLSVGDKKFTFDSVFNSNSTQEDVFQSVGIPLVKDALAGYNTSLLAYGQTGSGKTYTLFGPPSAMVESPSINGLQGLVPRIFQMLFSNIQSEHESSDYKQLSYQCRCSFLEIYNERIGDLLDPMQRDLKIKDDAKNGFYVENLTEEYVSTYEDVTQILIKGLSSRKVGSTGINSKSSRSHVVFTCIIESWCKENSSKCFGSSKTSRITLVDLAGFERNLLEDAGKQYITEGKFVKKSTSQLGRLVNILTEQNSTRVAEAVPYSCSSLTHLLRESLGGNAKLSVICTISQEDKHMSDTISTLRFGKKVKLMKNEPIINEITEDDVNGLSDQIRLLKEELIRARSSTNNAGGRNNGYFKGQSSTRESLNQLRVSLNRSLILPRFDNNDSKEEEINISEDDIKELQIQIDNIRNSHDEGSLMSEAFISCSEESESEEEEVPERETDLQDPVLSESPKIGNMQRKSIVVASSNTSLKNNEIGFQDGLRTSGLPQQPEKESRNLQTSSLRSSRIFPGPTESLAASLQRGLQIIDHHQQNSSESMRPSFSFDHFAVKSTTVQESSSQEEVQDSCLKTWIVPFGGNNNGDKQGFEKDLKDALEREKKLESVCEEQAEKIQKLNQLLAQCKCEIQKSDLDEAMDDKNRTQPINSQEKFLEWNCKGEDGNEQEIVKEIQGEVDHSDGGGGSCGTQCLDAVERDALVKEIESLRTKLQRTHTSDAISNNKSIEKLRQSRGVKNNGEKEEMESERQRWTEMESDWISLTDELRIDIETIRQRAEKAETELKLEKKCTAELDDALRRSVVGHARMVEHYVDLQEKHNELVEKHRLIMGGIQDIKMAAAKAGGGRKGNRFAKSLAAELSALRVERERERELLRKENRSLKAQLRDTAEAVHAAGELLVRLREAEETASAAEEKLTKAEEQKEILKKQIEKQKRKHKMEMATMKGYLAQSRLPEAALLGKNESESESMMMMGHNDTKIHSNYDHDEHDDDDDQAWRAEFGAIYQQDY